MKYYQFLIPTLLGLKNQKKVPSESMGVDDELNVVIQNEQSFEFTDCTLIYASTSLRMVVVYRPPPSQKN